jgi:rhodanese-related sulfurtransferase
MRNTLRFIALVLVFFVSACNTSQERKQDTNRRAIEIVAPKAMYEVLKEQPNAQLIDVRTDQEFGVSHLKNSQNICVTADDFEEKVASLNKNEPVYVYCKKGGRSARAAKVLRKLGFTKIYDLEGGITAWDKDQLETVQ